MASIYQDIRSTLENHLINTPSVPDIAWENVDYEPTTGTEFIVPRFIPTLRRPAHRGLNPQMRYDGVFQIMCYSPEGAGPGSVDALADLIMNRFEGTTDINYLSTTVSIEYAERQQSITSSPWVYVPVSIGWYIYN